ncbi:hypothetical protein GHT06_009689 [Daphnia sinensis]|uniref:GMPS ATP-PPase domain-containing protein n=1 Tax=Daphnia sinensis TaxID=1820382 RepID=A0AAD5PZH3_9CRUS|nr:hypothetical protein GHT06_009689 [Daphnia sinensis]
MLRWLVKTHNKDSEIASPLRLHGRVVGSLEDFHKDEVRALGRELGLPAELLDRHAFLVPVLLARLTVDYANMAAKELALLNLIEIATSEEELSSCNQHVATLLPIRTVDDYAIVISSYSRETIDVEGGHLGRLETPDWESNHGSWSCQSDAIPSWQPPLSSPPLIKEVI